MTGTAVVFLARGRDGGRRSAEIFLDSYRTHKTRPAADLVVVVKGWHGVLGLEDVRRSARAVSASVVELPDNGYDFGAYFRIAAQLDHAWLCLLNTHSRILADDWLDKLLATAERPGIGAAGATGSWGSLTPRWRGPGASVLGRIAWPLRFVAAIRRFPRFPNPHLRSNALIISRRTFVSFADAGRLPSGKADAQFLESGRGGLTAFLRSRGLRTVVVGADGQSFEVEDWIASGTFRVPGQANLMIADNQTRAYEGADRSMRRILEFAAWGKTLTL